MNTRGKRYHPVKPARSYKEQLARLTDIHGLTIEDEARARYILSTVNYYRLTTYGKHLRRADDPDLFLPGVSLETLYSLYRFDMNLRHLLLPVLEFFEVQLRAKVAYQLAITYGSLGYMDAENFRAEVLPNGASVHKSLIGKFKNEVKRQGALPFVRHHKIKYGGQFPIWAAVELFTFGMLGSLFDLMREGDQRAVSREYDLSPEALSRLIAAAVDGATSARITTGSTTRFSRISRSCPTICACMKATAFSRSCSSSRMRWGASACLRACSRGFRCWKPITPRPICRSAGSPRIGAPFWKRRPRRPEAAQAPFTFRRRISQRPRR